MFSDMTLGAKIFWCVFCLTYVAGVAFVRFIDKAIAESGRDTATWPHWATLVTIWLCSPVVIIRTIVWVAVTFIRMFRRNLNEIRSRRDEQPS